MRPTIAGLLLAALLVVPTAAHADTTHRVASGDTLGGIAEAYGVSVADLRRWNGIEGDLIRVNDELTIRGVRRARASTGSTSSTTLEHVVGRGELVGAIATRYGVSVQDIVSWNPGLNPDRVREGQTLRIRAHGRPMREVRHRVAARETLSGIAQRHGVSVNELVSWNPGLNPDRIREGQELVMRLRVPETPSESVGAANAGRLVNGEQLPSHPAYRIRDPDRAWGTNETVTAILDAFEHVRRRERRVPRLAVHDLSRREGGALRGHRSHESGRDADIGIYHTRCGQDCEYRRVEPEEFDAERMWALMSYWIERDLVEYIFLDYRLQRRLYEWLRDQGHAERDLARWIQYPRGRDRATGLIRHEPNHADHIHVRFSCGSSDARCR